MESVGERKDKIPRELTSSGEKEEKFPAKRTEKERREESDDEIRMIAAFGYQPFSLSVKRVVREGDG